MKVSAYIVEVKVDDDIRYLGAEGRLVQVPRFWRSKSSVLRHLTRSYAYNGWKKEHHPHTTVIYTTSLEKGLRDSAAFRMTYDEFLEFKPASKVSGDLAGAAYKLSTQFGTAKKVFAPAGSKFGKTWNRAGDLRSHLFFDIGRLLAYISKGYQVNEIVYKDDMLTPEMIHMMSIERFLQRSPIFAKKLDQLKRGSRSVAVSGAFMTAADKEL